MAQAPDSKTPTRILMDPVVNDKMWQLVKQCSVEVMWVGLIEQRELQNGLTYLHVYDVLVPEQEISGSSVDWEDTMNDLMMELLEQDRGDEIENMKFFGHSHVNFAVYHSGKDMQQIHDYATIANIPWFVSQIRNKKGEVETRFDQFDPFRVADLHVEQVTLNYDGTYSWAKKMLDERTTKKTWQTTHAGWQGGISAYNTHPSAPNALNLERMKEMFQEIDDRSKIQIHIQQGSRVGIVAGVSMIRQRISDGQMTFEHPVAKERWEATMKPEKEEHKLVTPTSPLQIASRSIARTEQKRAEGNSEREAEPSQTPTASEAASDSSEQKSGELCVLPDGQVATEEVLQQAEDHLEQVAQALNPDIDDDEDYSVDILGMTTEEWEEARDAMYRSGFWGHPGPT